MKTVVPASPQTLLPVHGTDAVFPVRRVYCVGRNYADHAREMGFTGREDPFFFCKPADAILYVPEGETGEMPYPPGTSNLHYEIELVVALGGGGRDLDIEQAAACIYGYAVGLDMTRRDLQAEAKKAGRPWTMAKGFDQSAPIGTIAPASVIGHPSRGAITLSVNGGERQRGDLAEQIWSVPETIAFLSRLVTLRAGDLIMTGTPSGVGAVRPRDVLEGEIEGVGTVSTVIA